MRFSAIISLLLISALALTSCSIRGITTGMNSTYDSKQLFEKNFADYNAGIEKSDSRLFWSPKGNYILFEGYKENRAGDKEYSIVIADLQTRKISWVREGRIIGEPSWSSDEKMVVFGSDGLYIYSTDTFSIKKITEKGKLAVVSPDNKKIAFVNDGIWIFDVERMQLKQLTKRKYDSVPLWFSDSKRIFFFRDTGKVFEGGNGNEQTMSILDINSPDSVNDVNTSKKGKFIGAKWLKSDESLNITSGFDDINNDFIYNIKQNEIIDVGSMQHGNGGYVLGTNREDAILMKAQNYIVQLYDFSMKKLGSYFISDDSDNSDAQVNYGHALLSSGMVLFLHSEPSTSSEETPKSALMLMQTSAGRKQFKLTNYDRYSQLSVSDDKKKAALLVDSEKLLLFNLKTADLKEIEPLTGKNASFEELTAMLPGRIGTEWTYLGTGEYGHKLKLDSIKSVKDGAVEYVLTGRVFNPSGAASSADNNLSIKYTVTSQSIRETVVKGKRLPNRIYAMDVLRAPLAAGNTWKQKARLNGVSTEITATIVEESFDAVTRDRLIKVEYSGKSNKLPDGVYRETRVFRESAGMISFENTFDADTIFSYRLNKIN